MENGVLLLTTLDRVAHLHPLFGCHLLRQKDGLRPVFQTGELAPVPFSI